MKTQAQLRSILEQYIPLEPKGYRILVKQDPIEKVSRGGIVLASPGEEKRQQKGFYNGTLVAVGDMAWKGANMGGKPWANIGDRVMFSRYAGHQFYQDPIDKCWWHVMNDEDVLGVIPPEEK